MAQDAEATPPLPHYRVEQLHSRRLGNEPVADLDGLVTHHPIANAAANIERGAPMGVEDARRRSYGVIGGELQELETRRTDGGNRSVLGEHQVLLIKDFMLEDSRIPSGGAGARAVDVPAPFAGYVNRVDAAGTGAVDIYDRQGGSLMARVLHMDSIHVTEGTTIEYGQALGVQNRVGLPSTAGKHVHMEVDTAHYQAYENYLGDLVSGRLAIDAARRTQGIDPRPVIDDGVVRVGESSERVRDAQRFLNQEGIRDAGGRELEVDGVYRLGMQPAVIRFQAARGIPQTGDLDAATLQHIPQPQRREVDRPDYRDRGFAPMGVGPFGTTTDPQVPTGHPLQAQAESAVRRLDESMGRTYDATSERMAGSLAILAKQNGFDRIDHALLSIQSEQTRAGERVFIVQGDPADPGKRRAQMQTQDAIAVPPEESLKRLTALEQASPQQTQTQQLDQSQQQHAPRIVLA